MRKVVNLLDLDDVAVVGHDSGGLVARHALGGDEFDELFLQPIHRDPARREAAVRVLRSFDHRQVDELASVHERIKVPVRLIWGERDKFFPVERARAMTETFPDATLTVIEGAGLFSHEERPAEVAAAMLPVLLEPVPSR